MIKTQKQMLAAIHPLEANWGTTTTTTTTTTNDDDDDYSHANTDNDAGFQEEEE